MSPTTAALVGATGGAGTTRCCLELATALAADGADVAVLDAAYDTQGLARHLPGRLDPDMTALVTDETESTLAAGLVAFDPAERADAFAAVDGDPEPGRIACCPAHAPFERLARAKTPDAAQALEYRIEEAAATFDYVLVDTPPLGSNPAVAAVTAADRISVVAPATSHGLDAAQVTRGRLKDVRTAADAVVAVDRAGSEVVPQDDATVVVPSLPGDAPTALTTERGLDAMERLAGAVVDDAIDFAVADEGLADKLSSIRTN
ncbi:MAG: AAA family ATPase [Halolamina sp.]|uniref:AAA family ATPase n=1 Tax=Halolamina sp. TaxID=1940283 RepID=UPI002FC3B590